MEVDDALVWGLVCGVLVCGGVCRRHDAPHWSGETVSRIYSTLMTSLLMVCLAATQDVRLTLVLLGVYMVTEGGASALGWLPRLPPAMVVHHGVTLALAAAALAWAHTAAQDDWRAAGAEDAARCLLQMEATTPVLNVVVDVHSTRPGTFFAFLTPEVRRPFQVVAGLALLACWISLRLGGSLQALAVLDVTALSWMGGACLRAGVLALVTLQFYWFAKLLHKFILEIARC